MRISSLTFLAFYINGAIDSGNYDDVLIDEVRQEICEGTIFAFLGRRLGGDIDLTILDKAMEAELLTEWQDLEAAINARRKFGVDKRGLTLLVAYLLEGIQIRARMIEEQGR